jgi:FRG domain
MNKRVKSLTSFLRACRRLRRDWEVKPFQELWFRAEDASHVATRLQPGLYRPRDKDATRKPVQKLLKLENELYEEFGRCGTQLSPGDTWAIDDEWHSYFLMQHHGVPTRILDWTDGALIALHFAVGHTKDFVPQNDCIIYVLDPYWLLKRLEKDQDHKDAEKRWETYWKENRPYDTDKDDWDRLYLPFGKDNPEQPSLNMPSTPLLWDSPHVTRRIAAQRSRFMIFGKDPQYLVNMEQEREAKLAAICIPKDFIVSIRQELRDAGITESVVFPDLDGLGRELNHQWKLRN